MWDTLRFLYTVVSLPNPHTLTPERIAALQEKRLRTLLQQAAQYSPFYRKHYKGIDLEKCSLRDVPPVTKASLMANFNDVVTDRCLTREGIDRFVARPENYGKYYLGQYAVTYTSGSQGQPALIVYHKDEMRMTLAVQAARGHTQPRSLSTMIRRRLDSSRLALVTFGPGFYPSGSAFSYLPRGAQKWVRRLWLSRSEPLADNVARLNQYRPNALISFSSVLETLAREERAGRLQLRQSGALRLVTNISEPLLPEARAVIEQAFGVPVTNQYGMGECMALSCGCTQSAGAHLNADLAMLEVVDADGRAVPAGQTGSKILVTNLYNRTQPFIRYEVDDVVTMSAAPCHCGNQLPLIQSIGGRTKDKLWVEVGGEMQELSYYVFVTALHHFKELAEHQIIQTGRNSVVVRLAPQRGKAVDEQAIEACLNESIRIEGLSGVLRVRLEVVDEIPPDPRSGKMKRVINLVDSPRELASSNTTTVSEKAHQVPVRI